MNRHTAAIIKRGSRTLTTSRILANTAATLPSQEAETSTQAQQRAEAAAVKARAWYLDDAEPSSPSESPRRPVFTTFNALDTLPEPAANTPLQPFPADAPVFAHPLYDFLTTNELFVPHSISFNKTSTSSAARSVADLGDGSSPERGRRRRGKVDSGEGIVIPGHEVGAFWDWVVIAQVAARGKGAIGRGERNIREWLLQNPLNSPSPNPLPRKPKIHTTANPDSDWIIIDAGHGICLNILTAEGRERWDLEGAWRAV